MTAWKRYEDTICGQLGGRRVLGNRGGSVPDSDENVPFAVECKKGYVHFQLREKWIEQARRNAVASGKPWLLVQAPKHSRRSVVTMDFETFVEIVRRAGMVT